jgi:hypothetical protein
LSEFAGRLTDMRAVVGIAVAADDEWELRTRVASTPMMVFAVPEPTAFQGVGLRR